LVEGSWEELEVVDEGRDDW
jgi:hypothetical protein